MAVPSSVPRMADDGPDPEERIAEALADAEGMDLGKAIHASRVALRWHDQRMRRDAELCCRSVLAQMRYTMPYEELHSSQQNAVNQEVAAIINVFAARMTDFRFAFLGSDQRERLQPERQVRRFGGVQ